MSINCIIIDDEPIAQDIIEEYVLTIDELTLIDKCRDVQSALKVMRNNRIDLLFLDIQMPQYTGLEFIKSLTNPPKVIFTTAHSEFALDAFEENAVDYLLKPVSYPRFAKAVARVLNNSESTNTSSSINQKRWLIKSGTKSYSIKLEDILVIEGMENYVKIICVDEEIISLNTLSSIEKQFSNTSLTRIHRSYLINLNKVKYVESTFVTIGNKKYSIGPSFRKAFSEKIKTHFDSL